MTFLQLSEANIIGTVIAFILGLFIVPLVIAYSEKKGLMDKPSERKIHSHPIPRLGGVAIWICSILSFFSLILLSYYPHRSLLSGLLLGSSLIFLLGLIDDIYGLGAKFKFLAGIVHASAEINELNISMSQDKWQIQEKGRIFTTPGIQINYKDNGEIDNIDTGTFGMDGVGIGFDLGATYKLLDNLTLSAALTDIGFISWKGAEAKANPDPFIFDGFHHFGAEDDPVTGESQLDQETDQLEEDLKNLVRFQNNQDSKSTRSLTTTLNIGGEYSILSDKISFGLLSSTRFGLPTVWTELMASANFRPVSWFNATINGSFSNIGQSMGVLLNFNPKGFNFYIGSDYIPFRYSKEGIPLYHAKANITMGISFTFKHREK